MQDDREICSCDLVATSSFCDLLDPAPVAFLLTTPSVIRSRMLFGRLDLTCHFHEGARLPRVGLSILLRKAPVLRHFYF